MYKAAFTMQCKLVPHENKNLPIKSNMASPSELVTRTVVKDILKKQDNVISTDSSASLSEAFTKIVDQRISSVPVFSTVENRYSSFIDVLDISMYVVSVSVEQSTLTHVSSLRPTLTWKKSRKFSILPRLARYLFILQCSKAVERVPTRSQKLGWQLC